MAETSFYVSIFSSNYLSTYLHTDFSEFDYRCPLDRIDLLRKKEKIPPPPNDDEEEWDENYG